MDFGFTEEQRLLRDSVRKLLQKHAPPEYVRKHDRERTYPEELFQACAFSTLSNPMTTNRFGAVPSSAVILSVRTT